MSYSGRRLTLCSLIILILMLADATYALSEPRPLEYPPLKSVPTDMLSDERGNLLFALPEEKAIALYDVASRGQRYVRLDFAPVSISYSDGKVLAYSSTARRAALVDLTTFEVKEIALDLVELEGVQGANFGFCILGTDISGTVLLIVDADGKVIRSLRVELLTEGRRGMSCTDDVVWGISRGRDRVLRISIRDGSVTEVSLNRKAIAVSAVSKDEAWVATSDDRLLRLTVRGVQAEFELHRDANLSPAIFALRDGRVYHVDTSGGYVTEIDGDKKRIVALELRRADLAALQDEKALYVLSSTDRKLAVVYTSRPPIIKSAKFSAVNRTVLSIEAKVTDPDDDLAEGYPLAVVRTETFQERSVVMRRVGDDQYVSTIDLSGVTGQVEVMVVALDAYGNFVESRLGSYSIRAGVEGQTTTGEGESQIESDRALVLLLLESVLLAAFLAAILGVLVRRRKGRARRRR